MRTNRAISLAALSVVWWSVCLTESAYALTACTAADISAQDPANCPSGLGPCTITKSFSIGTTLDFGARDVTIAASSTLTLDSGSVTINARNFTVAPGGVINGLGTSAAPNDTGGSIFVNTTGSIAVQKQSTSVGKITMSGDSAAGTIQLNAGGSVTVGGWLRAEKTAPNAYGGSIDITAGLDIVTLNNSLISAVSGTVPGEVTLSAGGKVDLGDLVDLDGVDGGDLTVIAGGEVIVRPVQANGRGDGTLGGFGDGGDIDIEAGTRVQLLGAITTTGTTDGDGGSVTVAADFGDITISGTISADAINPFDGGGGGGEIDLSAVGSLDIEAAVSAQASGSDSSGGDISGDAQVDITIGKPLDVSGGSDGGTVDLDATGNLSVNATLKLQGTYYGGFGGDVYLAAGDGGTGTVLVNALVDVGGGACGLNYGCGAGGTTTLEGCNVIVSSSGTLDARAPGGTGTHELIAHEQLTISGSVYATHSDPSGTDGSTTLIYPSRKPAISAGLIQPPPIVIPKDTCTGPAQPNCLDPCPLCGNGIVEFPETCDDGPGTPLSCDGCSRFCRIENCNDNNPCTTDLCDPLLGCTSVLQQVCPTPTPTPVPVQTYAVSGHVHSYGSGAPVEGVEVYLSGPTPQVASTDSSGGFAFTGLGEANWTLEPRKQGGGNAISALDAVYVLQGVVGLRPLDSTQRLACDTSGDGALTTLDAVFILQ
jgi:cysteine-rich repeat protein